MKRPLALLLAIACLILPAAWADEARIPIYQQTIITESGYYILTRDLVLDQGIEIYISADNVTLDLNGHTIRLTTNTASAVFIPNAFRGIVIRNGHVLGGSTGIGGGVPAGSITKIDVRIENVEIRGAEQGIAISNAGTVEVISCRIADAKNAGISFSGPTGIAFGGRIVDTVVDNTQSDAIALQTPRGMEIRRNLITNFGTASAATRGILVSGTTEGGGNIIEDNVLRLADTDSGIVVVTGENNLIANNVITRLGGYGLAIETSGNRIVGNVISRCARGLSLGTSAYRNMVEHNHFEDNTQNGIWVSGSYNLIDSNISEGNNSYGLVFDSTASSNAYRNNMLRGNNVGAVNGVATDAGGNIL